MSSRPPRQTVGPMRRLFDAALVAASVAFVVLYVFPGNTDTVFAWTIDPPLTAAFLGAGYGSGVVLVLLSRREPVWAKVRLGFTSVLVFSVLALLATLVHLDRFHFDSGGSAGFAAWAWLFVYVVVPPAMALLLIRQRKEPGEDAPKDRPLPGWMAAILTVGGAILVVWGVALFLAPESMAGTWPWRLSALTGRMAAAWMIPVGMTGAVAVREADLNRLRTPCAAMFTYGVLTLVAVARLNDQVEWSRGGTWLFGSVMIALTGASAFGLAGAEKATAPGT